MTRAPLQGFPFELQSAKTTGNGNVAVVNNYRNHKFSIIGAGTITDGTVQLESSDDENYAGTWNPISGGPIDVPADGITEVSVVALYKCVRARIDDDVVGGTVTVKYTGLP